MADDAQARATGHRVLAGLAKGRAVAIERARQRAAQTERLILRELNRDILTGRPPRGRAGRIHRRIGGEVSVRTIAKYLERLSSASDSSE